MEEDKDSVKSFRYQKDVEARIGKYTFLFDQLLYILFRRTGNYVRKSDIHKEFDGLHNMNEYFETNTDKMSVATTDDFESSLTSDILVGNFLQMIFILQ